MYALPGPLRACCAGALRVVADLAVRKYASPNGAFAHCIPLATAIAQRLVRCLIAVATTVILSPRGRGLARRSWCVVISSFPLTGSARNPDCRITNT